MAPRTRSSSRSFSLACSATGRSSKRAIRMNAMLAKTGVAVRMGKAVAFGAL